MSRIHCGFHSRIGAKCVVEIHRLPKERRREMFANVKVPNELAAQVDPEFRHTFFWANAIVEDIALLCTTELTPADRGLLDCDKGTAWEFPKPLPTAAQPSAQTVAAAGEAEFQEDSPSPLSAKKDVDDTQPVRAASPRDICPICLLLPTCWRLCSFFLFFDPAFLMYFFSKYHVFPRLLPPEASFASPSFLPIGGAPSPPLGATLLLLDMPCDRERVELSSVVF